jgi:hypothetical protein
MAQLHRVEINEKAPQEIDPESEEAIEATPEEQTEDRPEWLPEKFKSPEDMAIAYSELEKKMGAGVEQEEESEVQEETDDTQEEDLDSNNIVVEASKEFFQNDGKLSEETYEKLAKAGISREIVDSYAAGQKALMDSQEGDIKSVTNGEWDAMADWATNNLSPQEIETFDQMVTQGSVDQAKLAVKGVYAQYRAENGSGPRLVQGAVSGSSTIPFKSNQELARAMSNPKYKSGDKAYHEEIDRRIAVSQNYI